MLILTMIVAADITIMKRCEASKPVGGSCQWRHGVISAGNGAYPSRLGVLDSSHDVFAIQQPGVGNPNEYAPPAAAKILRQSPNIYEARGNYRVCSVKSDDNNKYLVEKHLKLGCIAGENNVILHKR